MSPTKRSKLAERTRVLIMGAAGFDYHVFNMLYRGNAQYDVVAFSFCGEQNLGTTTGTGTARKYPSDLAGAELYPNGIPFIPETALSTFLPEHRVQLVVFAYSDISHVELMHRASLVLAAGSDFILIAPQRVQLKSSKPVISICAVRTGVGKSSVAKQCVKYLKSLGRRVVAVREPMPYGDLSQQACMRFEKMEDLEQHKCTVEEREEYEQYVTNGMVIFSGVDYERVLREAEREADVIVWDGGNNEVSFFQSRLLLVLADPLRQGHENRYHPGETNCRMADAFVLTKCHEASLQDITSVETTLLGMAKKQSHTPIVRLQSVTRLEFPEADSKLVQGKRVVVVDDGPTLTHGNTSFGAGYVLAQRLHLQVVDPKPSAKGSFIQVFHDFPHLTNVVPAMGYSEEQLNDLAETLNASGADVVINGSPSDLKHLLGDRLKLPMVRVFYDVEDAPGTKHTLRQVLDEFAASNGL